MKPDPERAVEHAGSGLKHEVCSGSGPSHLLLLGKALSYNRIDRGFDECGRHPFPGAMALGVVRDGVGIVGAIGLELADTFSERLGIRILELASVRVSLESVHTTAHL